MVTLHWKSSRRPNTPWTHICEYTSDWYVFVYNFGERNGLHMWLINERLSLTVSSGNNLTKFHSIGEKWLISWPRDQMRGHLLIARMKWTMECSPWTRMFCPTKNKVGVIQWFGVLSMFIHDALEIL